MKNKKPKLLENIIKSYMKFYNGYYDYWKKKYDDEGLLPEITSSQDFRHLYENEHQKVKDIIFRCERHIHFDVLKKLSYETFVEEVGKLKQYGNRTSITDYL